jgi:hypothetical protein
MNQDAAQIHACRESTLMRKAPDLPAVCAEMAAAENEVGAAADDRLEELRIVGDVIFKIGVLDEEYVAGRRADPGADGVPLAVRPRLEDDFDPGLPGGRAGRARVSGTKRVHDLPRAVGRAALDDDDFLVHARNALAPHPAEEVGDGRRLVIDGNDDGYEHLFLSARPSGRGCGSRNALEPRKVNRVSGHDG